MKKILALVISLAMMYTCAIPSMAYAAYASTPTIIVSDVSGKVGEEIEVTISLEGNPGVVAMRLTLSYETKVLQLIKVSDKGKLGEPTHGNNLKSPYSLYWDGGTGIVNNTYNGEIVALTFKILSESAGSPITVSYGNYGVINKEADEVHFDIKTGTVSTSSSKNPGSDDSNIAGPGSSSGESGYASPTIKIPNREVPLSSFADAQTLYADELYKLGLFIGTVANVETPVYELEVSLNRIQALILVIRLLGLEKNALAFSGENNFSDVPNWAWRYAAYAFQNGITSGINPEGTLFDPDRIVTCQEFTAFLLRALGYSEKAGDFIYADTLKKAFDVGLYDESTLAFLNNGKFLRGYAVIAMIKALSTDINGVQSTSLLYSLVERKLFTIEEAKAFEEAVASITFKEGE